ncbi:MAG TPA: sigma-70 family RNA polymerase sigma factor [Candidatus Eremiobacteraceae bacterium]|nr:sigma-70 family RNA polymerase sigma factor [Candidatus Eremiobacteraceae bacterium]
MVVVEQDFVVALRHRSLLYGFAARFNVLNCGRWVLFHEQEEKYLWRGGNKTCPRWFTLVCVSQESLSSGTFEQLAMPHFDRLYNFACWLTHDRQEAEDLVQETYAKALKGFSSFQPGTNFRAWIYRILRNAFLTSRTGLQATATVPLDLDGEAEALPTAKETPESILLQRSDLQLVQKAMEQLPVAYREVLLLCEVEEMSYQEISATLSIPIGTVMSRLSRARQALRVAVREKQGSQPKA